MKPWVRGLVLGVKVWLIVLGRIVSGRFGQLRCVVPVLTTNTLPVIGTDVVGSQITFVAGFSSDSPRNLSMAKKFRRWPGQHSWSYQYRIDAHQSATLGFSSL